MAQLAFLISLVALGISILAYQEAGGAKDLTKKVESLREDLRRETADGLEASTHCTSLVRFWARASTMARAPGCFER